MKNTPQFWK